VTRGGRQRCDVWVAAIDLRRPVDGGLLDDVERARAAAFVRSDDRARFVVGAALLKLAVADQTGDSARSVRVDRRCASCGGPHGRPQILESALHVSISHSGSLVAVALSRAGAVGVDVEHRTARALPAAGRILTPSEPLGRPEDLYTYWCRKESVVKATGEGWQVPCREVVVSRPEDRARLVSYHGKPLTAFMTDLDLGDAYAAALTVLSSDEINVHVRPAALSSVIDERLRRRPAPGWRRQPASERRTL
jgi:4'-phosphopantetheinyl transferase